METKLLLLLVVYLGVVYLLLAVGTYRESMGPDEWAVGLWPFVIVGFIVLLAFALPIIAWKKAVAAIRAAMVKEDTRG